VPAAAAAVQTHYQADPETADSRVPAAAAAAVQTHYQADPETADSHAAHGPLPALLAALQPPAAKSQVATTDLHKKS
jgi:hypothetical protein